MVKGQTRKWQNSSIDQPWCQSHFTFTFDSIHHSSALLCCKLSLKDPQGLNIYKDNCKRPTEPARNPGIRLKILHCGQIGSQYQKIKQLLLLENHTAYSKRNNRMLTNVTGEENPKTNEQLYCSAELTGGVHIHFIFLAVINIFMSITTFLGNTLILVALRKESSLHPPSKLLYRNLAITDLCVGIIVGPFSALRRWNDGIFVSTPYTYHLW